MQGLLSRIPCECKDNCNRVLEIRKIHDQAYFVAIGDPPGDFIGIVVSANAMNDLIEAIKQI